MNPRVPDRNRAIFGTGKSCGPALAQMAANLARAQVDFVVCACNTAHAFQEDMIKGCGEDVPFLSLIEVTSNTVMQRIRQDGAAMKCGILAGSGCVEAKLYQNSLSRRAIEPILPTNESQSLMQNIIYRVKAGDKVTVVPDLVKILKELKDQGCSQIILGCTELPIIIEDCLKAYPELKMSELLDTSANMVETVVRLAKGDLDLETVLLECANIFMEEIESECEQTSELSTVHSSDDGSFINSSQQKKLDEVQNDASSFDAKNSPLETIATAGAVN